MTQNLPAVVAKIPAAAQLADGHLPHPKSAVSIIALTANAMSGVEEQYRKAGMDGYVAKPIQTAELFVKLSQIARARDQLEILSEDNAEASPN